MNKRIIGSIVSIALAGVTTFAFAAPAEAQKCRTQYQHSVTLGC